MVGDAQGGNKRFDDDSHVTLGKRSIVQLAGLGAIFDHTAYQGTHLIIVGRALGALTRLNAIREHQQGSLF